MSLHLEPGGLRVGTRDFPTNRGGLCQKGWTAAELLEPGQRLTTPLMRAGRGRPAAPTASRSSAGAG